MNPYLLGLYRKDLLRLAAAFLALSLLLSFANDSQAQVDTFEFDNEVQQQRFRTLSNELRCPMCQNTNLSGSTGGVAEDLRREIHRMIMAGWSDREIEQFMYERYGDFIFYRPRLRPETVLLWFGPLLFLGIGAIVAVAIWRRARVVDDSELALDESQKARLKELLDNGQ